MSLGNYCLFLQTLLHVASIKKLPLSSQSYSLLFLVALSVYGKNIFLLVGSVTLQSHFLSCSGLASCVEHSAQWGEL